MPDLFFSYRRQRLERAQPLVDALARAGVRVWRDKSDIPDQASITAEIRQGIANAKALLACYSKTYPLSNPCQQEFTTAWLAAQQIDPTAPSRRVWIVNLESDFQHLPELFRDQQVLLITWDDSSLAAIAQGMKERLDALDRTLDGSEACYSTSSGLGAVHIRGMRVLRQVDRREGKRCAREE